VTALIRVLGGLAVGSIIGCLGCFWTAVALNEPNGRWIPAGMFLLVQALLLGVVALGTAMERDLRGGNGERG
jgi:hypothetical protein